MTPTYIDYGQSTPSEKELLLGREFRNLLVFGQLVGRALTVTLVHLDGREVPLVGDPQKALGMYLALLLEGGEPQ